MAMQTGPNLSEEMQTALRDALQQTLTKLGGRVYSPRIKLLDIHQVMEATGISQSIIYKLMSEGRFPKPQRDLGRNLWRESAIIAWMDRNDPNLQAGD